ncbi:MAG TPA: hypothetical protein VNA28_04155 [Solirubrobacteraceae bacterium]|nr:hypothetical protein [Solirubrobacteraceae bacterium]
MFATGQNVCIPLACYSNVLVTEEFSPIEAGGGGVHKLYAPGLGLFRIEPAGSLVGELLNLTSVVRLGRTARAQANARTLQLDQRAYDVVPDVYRKSAPAVLTTR